jgi:replicative DNA helicase
MREMAELVNPFEVGIRKRGFIYDSAKARWERYRSIEKDPALLKKIPYGIQKLDEYTNGGTSPGHITLFFAKSGGYKTKVKANILYNMSFSARKNVMAVTLEVPFDEYTEIIDSRNSLIDFDKLTVSTLDDVARERHRNALSAMVRDRPPLYLVDIPGDATTADLIGETELYYIKYGRYPEVVGLDYINEIDPVEPWGRGNTGGKFKNVGKEIRKIARTYKYAFISSMQENRKAKEEKKDKSKVDLENIGESHQFHNVCHLVVNLYQDDEGVDEASNTLNWGIKKNRYGPNHKNFTTFINPSLNYVGDRSLTFNNV